MAGSPPPAARPTGTRIRVRPGIGSTDTRSRRRRIVTWMLLSGAGILIVTAIVGENGYLATLRLKSTEAALTSALAQARFENKRLHDERERLQSDPNAAEYAIRDQLGYIRPGEIAVIVHESPVVAPQPPD